MCCGSESLFYSEPMKQVLDDLTVNEKKRKFQINLFATGLSEWQARDIPTLLFFPGTRSSQSPYMRIDLTTTATTMTTTMTTTATTKLLLTLVTYGGLVKQTVPSAL